MSLDTDWLQVVMVKLREKVLGFSTKALSDLYVCVEFCLPTNQHLRDSSCSSVVCFPPPLWHLSMCLARSAKSATQWQSKSIFTNLEEG